MINIIYSDMILSNEILNSSIFKVFLAGPTPRTTEIISWRINALNIINLNIKKDIIIYIPERTNWKIKFEYIDQIEWELTAMKNADKIIFWIPRELKYMPAFTTNVEFGMKIIECPEKILYGRPNDAPNNKYLDYLYKKYTNNIPINSLYELVSQIF